MRKVNRGQSAQPKVIAAPVGGLNTRDPLGEMPSIDAYAMVNLDPTETSVNVRLGSAIFATLTTGGVASDIESIMTYEGGAVQRLLAAGNGCIWDATAGGNNNAPLVTGRTNSRYITAMFSNAGAQFLIGVNGVDTPFSYNDAAGLATPVITGVTGGATALAFVYAYKGRLYFLANNQLGFYYLPVGNIAGAASYFDLTQVAKKGGYVVAIASYSFDTGVGPGEFMVFITSLGEYIVYQGNDPSTAASWSLVARYYAAAPVTRRCAYNFRGDLVVLTTEGVLPFSSIRSEGQADGGKNSLTDKISKSVADLVALYSGFPGWQMLTLPQGNKFILNCATAGGNHVQFVMNTRSKAWTTYVYAVSYVFGMATYNNNLYFASRFGRVYQGEVGNTDNGTNIPFNASQAYTDFDEDAPKQVTQATLDLYAVNGGVSSTIAGVLGTNEARNPVNLNSLLTVGPSAGGVNWRLPIACGETANTFSVQISCLAGFNGSTFQWTSTRYFLKKARGGLV